MQDKEEKEGLGIIGNAVQLVILAWSLGVISWSYFKATDKKKLDGNVKIVDNKDSKVGVVKK